MVSSSSRASSEPHRTSLILSPGGLCTDRFRLGDASLSLSGDEPLLRRFHAILGDCASDAPDDSLPAVHCAVDDSREDVEVVFSYPPPQLALRSFVEEFPGYAGALRSGAGDTLRFDPQSEWRGAVANCAINVTLAIQPEALFFHAASVDLAGRGILLVGPKEAGKSTTALALAARGHRLLGDEIAVVRTRSLEVLTFPRAVSVREGVHSGLLDERLRASPATEETYPDGSRRRRIRVSDLFAPVSLKPAPLAALFFLRPFGEVTRLERFSPSLDQATLLEPLGSSLWGGTGAKRRFQLLRILSVPACYYLEPGSPDETAERIETLMETL